MKERPILFNAAMVRAILAGTKTQTRRVVKPQPGPSADWVIVDQALDMNCTPAGYSAWFLDGDIPHGDGEPVFSLYGQPGDRLWVREAWGYFDPRGSGENYDDQHETAGPGPVAYCDELLQEGHPLRDFWRRRVAYKATFAEEKYGKGPVGPKKWRPSIHMPRWASRITLEITDVRVERLQDISEADAQAEGTAPVLVPPDGGSCPHVEGFRDLWVSISGAESWAANPWVWCVGFKRLEA